MWKPNCNKIIKTMDIKLYKKDEIRVLTNSKNSPFFDCSSGESNSDDHSNKFVSATFHDMHKFFIIRKGRETVVFSFGGKDVIKKSDFGYFSDGEILFTNSETID